jgi:hypothetical protein
MPQLAMIVTDKERELFLSNWEYMCSEWSWDDPRHETLRGMVKKWEWHDYFAIPIEDDLEWTEMLAAMMVQGTLLYISERWLVMCNDIFAWGCADAEYIDDEEFDNLYAMWYNDMEWGGARWCCIKRNEKPQLPVVKLMKEAGSWDDVLEALPENQYDAAIRKYNNPNYGLDNEPSSEV